MTRPSRRPRLQLVTVSRRWWLGLLLTPILTFGLGVGVGAAVSAQQPGTPPAVAVVLPAVSEVLPEGDALDQAVAPSADPRLPEGSSAAESEPIEPARDEAVRLEPSPEPELPLPTYKTRAPRQGFGVQVAAHTSKTDAEAFLRAHGNVLQAVGEIHVVQRTVRGVDWYRVRVGVFPSPRAARRVADALPEPFVGAMVVRYR